MERKLNRKDFLKFSCKATCFAGLGLALMSTESCSPFPVVKTKHSDGVIKVPLTSFAEKKEIIVRDLELEFDIMVKQKDGKYQILVLKCTHQDWLLSPNAKGFSCSLHGSTFDVDGKVMNGPATVALKELSYTVKDDFLIITL